MPLLIEEQKFGREPKKHIIDGDVSVLTETGVMIFERTIRNLLTLSHMGSDSVILDLIADRLGEVFFDGEQASSVDFRNSKQYDCVTQNILPEA